MKAVLIPGDGIGREIAESVRAVSTALNTGIEWQEYAAGAEYAAESGELIAPGTLFAIARVPGWCAHRVEEVEFANRIIRPAYQYVGHPQAYVALEER